MPNAIITCRICAKRYDKGAPVDPTQDDSTFVCAPCAVTLGGYPQNGYINPAVLRADTKNEKLASENPGWFKKLKNTLSGKR